MSENLTNRDRSRHVDVKVLYLRDLLRDGHVKLVWGWSFIIFCVTSHAAWEGWVSWAC